MGFLSHRPDGTCNFGEPLKGLYRVPFSHNYGSKLSGKSVRTKSLEWITHNPKMTLARVCGIGRCKLFRDTMNRTGGVGVRNRRSYRGVSPLLSLPSGGLGLFSRTLLTGGRLVFPKKKGLTIHLSCNF